MGKLYYNRTFIGNIARVVFLAVLATLTFGMVPQAGAVTSPSYDDSITSKVTPDKPVAVKDKNDAWNYDTETAKLQTNKQKTQVSFNIQVCTKEDFSSILLKIAGSIGDLDMSNVTNAVYKVYDEVYGAVYYVYQFVYTWVYDQGLSVANSDDYTLEVYTDGTKLASITLDLEAPPPEGGGGGGAIPPATTTTTSTGSVAVADGVGTLVVDAAKVEALLAKPETTQILFEIPVNVAAQGVVELPADTLAKVFAAGKTAVFKAAGVQLAIDPGDVDISALKGQGAKLKVGIMKSTAPLPGYASMRVAGEVFDIKIDVMGADGTRKGGIDTFASPVTLTLPYDPAKLAGASENLLGIYRYNETTGEWNLVPGSRVNKTDKTVSVNSLSLSKYAVMAYDVAFTDMVGHWAEADVKLLAARGIVKGMTATTFAPAVTVTRAQFATLLVKALGIAEQAATGERFKDVAAGAWYARAVETAAAKGLLSGYPDGTFKPDASISREELVVMVANALAYRGKDASGPGADEVKTILGRFADRNEIDSWAEKAAALVVKAGIVHGRAADQFAPRATAQRAEAAVMIKQMLAYLGEL